MSPDTILYALLVTTTLITLVVVRWTTAVRGAVKVKFGAGAGLFLLFGAIANVVLWVWLAVATGYWQFAALTLIQFLINQAASLGANGAQK